MTNGPDIISMEHLPTGLVAYTEYSNKADGAFYRGYLLAKLEQMISP